MVINLPNFDPDFIISTQELNILMVGSAHHGLFECTYINFNPHALE
jgi:hypothetical protein